MATLDEALRAVQETLEHQSENSDAARLVSGALGRGLLATLADAIEARTRDAGEQQGEVPQARARWRGALNEARSRPTYDAIFFLDCVGRGRDALHEARATAAHDGDERGGETHDAIAAEACELLMEQLHARPPQQSASAPQRARSAAPILEREFLAARSERGGDGDAARAPARTSPHGDVTADSAATSRSVVRIGESEGDVDNLLDDDENDDTAGDARDEPPQQPQPPDRPPAYEVGRGEAATLSPDKEILDRESGADGYDDDAASEDDDDDPDVERRRQLRRLLDEQRARTEATLLSRDAPESEATAQMRARLDALKQWTEALEVARQAYVEPRTAELKGLPSGDLKALPFPTTIGDELSLLWREDFGERHEMPLTIEEWRRRHADELHPARAELRVLAARLPQEKLNEIMPLDDYKEAIAQTRERQKYDMALREERGARDNLALLRAARLLALGGVDTDGMSHEAATALAATLIEAVELRLCETIVTNRFRRFEMSLPNGEQRRLARAAPQSALRNAEHMDMRRQLAADSKLLIKTATRRNTAGAKTTTTADNNDGKSRAGARRGRRGGRNRQRARADDHKADRDEVSYDNNNNKFKKEEADDKGKSNGTNRDRNEGVRRGRSQSRARRSTTRNGAGAPRLDH